MPGNRGRNERTRRQGNILTYSIFDQNYTIRANNNNNNNILKGLFSFRAIESSLSTAVAKILLQNSFREKGRSSIQKEDDTVLLMVYRRILVRLVFRW